MRIYIKFCSGLSIKMKAGTIDKSKDFYISANKRNQSFSWKYKRSNVQMFSNPWSGHGDHSAFHAGNQNIPVCHRGHAVDDL